MAPLPTRILRAGGIARPGECVRRCGRRVGWSLQVQHRAAARPHHRKHRICVCVYEITPYARINIYRELEMAPLYTHILGAGRSPGRRSTAWRSDRDSRRRAPRATGPPVAPWKAGWPSSRPWVSWVDGRIPAGHPARRRSEPSWPPPPSVTPAEERLPVSRASAVLQVDGRKQDRLIAQGNRQLGVAAIVALAVPSTFRSCHTCASSRTWLYSTSHSGVARPAYQTPKPASSSWPSMSPCAAR